MDLCWWSQWSRRKGKVGEAYNIGTGVEKSIEDIADSLLTIYAKPKTYKKYVPDSAGHDKRYVLDTRKIKKELGWKPRYDFDNWLKKTCQWYKENDWLWKPLKKEAEKFYKRTKQI